MAKVQKDLGSATFTDTFVPKAGQQINVGVWGTFVGTVLLERSFDGGANWALYVAPGSSVAIFSTTVPANTRLDPETEDGIFYRLRVSAFTSGTITTRISN